MAEDISTIISNTEFTRLRQSAIEKLKVVLQESLFFSFRGGLFKADAQTLSFVKLLYKYNQPIVLIDTQEEVIDIEYPDTFINTLLETYYKATNQYLTDYKRIKEYRRKEDFVS